MEFHEDFIRAFVPRLEWNALVGAAKQVRRLTKSEIQERSTDH